MKKLITLLLVVSCLSIFAQVPQGISYQGIAFNAGGNPVVSSNVGIRLSILDNSSSGTVVYSERQVKTTNNKGLFNLIIGQGGTPLTGTFAGINWAVNSKFLKVEIDPAGGTTYTNVGTSQMMSVPYAFLAGQVVGQGSTNTNIVSYKAANGDGTIVAYTDHEVKGYNPTTGWSSASDFTETIKGAIASNNIVVVYSDHEVKAFSASGWSSGSDLTNTIQGAVACKTAVVVYTTKEVKGYSTTTGWSSGSDFDSTVVGAVSGGNGIVIYTSHEVKGFSAAHNWSSGSDLTAVIKGAAASGNSVVVYTNNELKAYNSGTGSWSNASDFGETFKGIKPTE